ncbi:MAG: NusA-like transcription termination signal-binding factor [archaeon]|nr:NusA-like transcription termination signal-binding factor [archaeon]MCP8319780.1 NusA-like transcription termination signal-binding factor [archaeon]
MMEKIKLTSEELGLISLFQSISGVTAKDCIIDNKMCRVIFVVNKGEMGLAIGKKGQSIRTLEKLIGKPVELVEYSDDPKEFIGNALNAKYIYDIRLTKRLDGTKIGVIVVDQRHKGAAVGKGGKNAEKVRLLVKRYFQIDRIHIVAQ